jgi:hypothetical protein
VLLGSMLLARGPGSASAVRALEETVRRPEVLAALDALAGSGEEDTVTRQRVMPADEAATLSNVHAYGVAD